MEILKKISISISEPERKEIVKDLRKMALMMSSFGVLILMILFLTETSFPAKAWSIWGIIVLSILFVCVYKKDYKTPRKRYRFLFLVLVTSFLLFLSLVIFSPFKILNLIGGVLTFFLMISSVSTFLLELLRGKINF